MVSQKLKAYREWYAEQMRLGKGGAQGRLKGVRGSISTRKKKR